MWKTWVWSLVGQPRSHMPLTRKEVKAIRKKKRKARISFWLMLRLLAPRWFSAVFSLTLYIHGMKKAKHSLSQPPQEDTHLLTWQHVETTLSESSKLQNCARKKTMSHTQSHTHTHAHTHTHIHTHTHTHTHSLPRITLQIEFHSPSPLGSVPPPLLPHHSYVKA